MRKIKKLWRADFYSHQIKSHEIGPDCKPVAGMSVNNDRVMYSCSHGQHPCGSTFYGFTTRVAAIDEALTVARERSAAELGWIRVLKTGRVPNA